MNRYKTIGLLGGSVAMILVITVLLTDLPREINIGLIILVAIIISNSYVLLWHSKRMKTDKEYKINVSDERNIAIKEKAGNITNTTTTIILWIVTVVFIMMNYIIPAIILGAVIFFQPLILVIASELLERSI
ncbi:MAG: hypothetical protein ACOWWR_02645 [Eubacteriales bacterium]